MKQIFYINSALHEEQYMHAKSNNLKLTFKYTTCLLVFTFLLVALQSCSKMNDLHQPYLDEGEHVYAEKVDTVLVSTGNKRIKFEMHISTESIETARIYWNNYTDSIDVDIANQRGVFEKLVEGLNEQQYVFQFVTFDSYGNKSLPYEVLGQVYGDEFQNLVSNRTIIGDYLFVNSNDELIINWSPDITNVAYCELTYIDSNDDEVTLQVPADEDVSFLPNFKSNLEYFTASIPDSTSIDLFYAETIYVERDILLDYNEWSIVDFSTQHGGGENTVANVIDGNQNTRWHSLAGGSSYPHWVIVDLGGEVTFSTLEVLRSTYDGGGDNRAPDKFQFEVSTDNVTWVDMGIFDFDRHTNDGQFYSIIPPNPVRYIRFTGTEGPENNFVLGAILLYK